jgi:hypothetical protein
LLQTRGYVKKGWWWWAVKRWKIYLKNEACWTFGQVEFEEGYGILGKVITRPEACSTMKVSLIVLRCIIQEALVASLSKQGQEGDSEDECARGVSNFADARILILGIIL